MKYGVLEAKTQNYVHVRSNDRIVRSGTFRIFTSLPLRKFDNVLQKIVKMGIDFVELEFWTYGFAGGLFTYSVFPTYAVMAALWFGPVFMAVHLEDALQQLREFHTWPFISISCGLVVGLTLAWALRLPVLLDTTIRNTRNRKRNWAPEFSILVLAAILLTLAFYYLMGFMSDGLGIVPFGTATTVGWAMLVAGVALLAFWSKHDRFNKIMNGKYSIVVSILLAVAPSTYDYIHNFGFSPYHAIITPFAIAVQWIVLYFLIGLVYFYKKKHSRHYKPTCGKNGYFGNYWKKESADDDTTHIDRLMSYRQLLLLCVLGAIAQITLYIVAGIVDVVTGDLIVPPVVAAIGGVSALHTIIFLIVGNSRGTLEWLFGRHYDDKLPREPLTHSPKKA